MGPTAIVPALFTSTSTPPKWLTTSPTMRATSSCEQTSQGTAMTSTPWGKVIDRVRQFLRTPRANRQPRPLHRELSGHHEPQPARAAGDEDDLAREVEPPAPPYRRRRRGADADAGQGG